MLPRIALTTGEPAGIGPELAVQLAQDLDGSAEIIAIGDPDLLKQRAAQLNIALELRDFNPATALASQKNTLSIIPTSLAQTVQPGTLNAANARYVLETLSHAAQLCLDAHCHAICTAPVHKAIINDAGIAFSGHTEFFADFAKVDKVVMMLETTLKEKPLRVALATTHLPLRNVADAINHDSLKQVITILHAHLKNNCALENPCIMVAGLNPHAGEDGHLGDEEITIINPLIEQLQQQGLDIRGSYPADTLFTPPYIAQADAFLAMYHDQGLPVLKHAGFHHAANITLGLPFIRTSVDHGTALDLAGSGKASYSSLQTALNCAIDMAQKKFS